MKSPSIFKPYMKVKDPDKAHAKLSASGAERWMGCPGCVRESEGIPSVENEASTRGTNTHTLMQFILENYSSWERLIARPDAKAFKDFIEYDDAMLVSAMVGVKYVWAERERMLKRNGVEPIMHIEKKLELERVGFGTSDVILYQPFGVLHVMDFKNGVGVVEPEENYQGLYYAVAAADLHAWDFRECWITIIQPNAPHKAGPIRTWKTTPARLEQAQREFRIKARATQKPDAPLVMNAKWCWFCPARQTCPEQRKASHKKIAGRFER